MYAFMRGPVKDVKDLVKESKIWPPEGLMLKFEEVF